MRMLEGGEMADVGASSEEASDELPPVAGGTQLDSSDSSDSWALVQWSRERASQGQSHLNDLIAKYQDRPLLDFALRFYQRDRESAATIVGSALAYRLFLFLVPLTLFVVGVLGFLNRWVQATDLQEATGLTGTLAEQIDTAMTQPNSTRWVATIVGLTGMAWTGRSLSKVLVTASCLAWRMEVTTKASLRVIGSVVGLVAGIAVVASVMNRIRREFGVGVAGLSFMAVFVIYGLAWLALSMLLPRKTNDPSALLPGAVVVGAVLTVMQGISQLYVPDKVERASQLYGAIGLTLVFLGWFFFLGRAMVSAMALNAVIYERFGSISQFVFGLPLVRILPRKSAWIRRFFDLKE
jgi:uncharacterized BrkB/YihY/UPF0761 family membrane protein